MLDRLLEVFTHVELYNADVPWTNYGCMYNGRGERRSSLKHCVTRREVPFRQKWVPRNFLGGGIAAEAYSWQLCCPSCAECQSKDKRPNIPSPLWIFMTCYGKALFLRIV